MVSSGKDLRVLGSGSDRHNVEIKAVGLQVH